MAIYHLRASMISRSAGRSATGAAAYRAGELIHDERTGLDFDYRARSGVTHVEILAPAHAPDWVHDRSELWNRVEAAETRKNSQLAREIRVALPAELDHEARVELVRAFCQRSFVDRGMVADIALHAPGLTGDERNHHAHILLTTREIDADGFTTKNRDWNAVAVLEDWREAWAQDSNAALEQAGHALRIDHRTLEAQREEALELAAEARERGDEVEELAQTVRAVELDREPLPQLSLGAWQLKERGIEVAAVQGRTNANLAAGYGFTGILVAFLARQNPLAIIPVAILLGGISASGGLLQRRLGLPDASVLVLQGIIFVFVLASDALYGRIGFLKGKS